MQDRAFSRGNTHPDADVQSGQIRVRDVDSDTEFSELIEVHGDCIYRYCRRILGNNEDADDVSQTVFVQAFQSRSKLPQVRNVRAWLLGIARYRCLDHLKLLRCAPRLEDGEDLDVVAEQNPEDPALGGDPLVKKALDECLDGLDDRSRAVLIMRFCDELSYQEITRCTSDNEGALRVRVARALPHLRRCLEKKGITL